MENYYQHTKSSSANAVINSLALKSSFSHLPQSAHEWQHAQSFLPTGLPRAALHEFFLSETDGIAYLPTAFIIAGVRAALQNTSAQPYRKITVWIGRNRWPTPYALPEELRAHAYFVNPKSEKQFLWTLDAALRSPAVGAVIAHQDRIPFTLSQRFALAARSSGAIGIITRPENMLSTPSAAPFRWEVTPAPSATHQSRWKVTLHKAKQSLPINNNWIIDYEDQTFSLRIPTELVDRGSKESSIERNGTFN